LDREGGSATPEEEEEEEEGAKDLLAKSAPNFKKEEKKRKKRKKERRKKRAEVPGRVTSLVSKTEKSVSLLGGELGPICCFFLVRGCTSPGGPCLFRHAEDDGKPCSFGATCRLGHSKRVLSGSCLKSTQKFWREYRENGNYEGDAPSDRDATLLRSQLEPWPTSFLRSRLISDFGFFHTAPETLSRADVMGQLLSAYATRPRQIVKVDGKPVRKELVDQLLAQLKVWEVSHKVNNRPSIRAKSYMILRSPSEFSQKDSKKAQLASRKIAQYRSLWDLSIQTIEEADKEFAGKFTALAVTSGFSGSPHIDKQNTGPFYGLALGDFAEGEGSLCVEATSFIVAQVNTKERLAKVDGRYPHWVSPYDSSKVRYSLIFYQTEGLHSPLGPPFFSPAT